MGISVVLPGMVISGEMDGFFFFLLALCSLVPVTADIKVKFIYKAQCTH